MYVAMVCMYVYMYACMYVCMYVCMYTMVFNAMSEKVYINKDVKFKRSH